MQYKISKLLKYDKYIINDRIDLNKKEKVLNVYKCKSLKIYCATTICF